MHGAVLRDYLTANRDSFINEMHERSENIGEIKNIKKTDAK